jgi:protein-S-isoprenylcysteine O-methyltransferase Ste14
MPIDETFWRPAVVFASGVVYWAGVIIQVRRIRRHIGKSPNVKPRGSKEKLLWLGWFAVIVVWLVQPLVFRSLVLPAVMRPAVSFLNPTAFWIGIALIVLGYLATLWCYTIMGDAWRMGINRKEKNLLVTDGPYGVVRHPIYLFQIVMLAGAALLLPTVLSLLALILHVVCVWIKAADEEAYLLTVHGDIYREYLSRTGRLIPRLVGKPRS